MALQTIKSGQTLTLTAVEDELLLVGPFPSTNQVTFTNVSGTSKFGIGGPIAGDTSYTSYTTAGTVVTMTVNFLDQLAASSGRIHCSGVGVWKVAY